MIDPFLLLCIYTSYKISFFPLSVNVFYLKYKKWIQIINLFLIIRIHFIALSISNFIKYRALWCAFHIFYPFTVFNYSCIKKSFNHSYDSLVFDMLFYALYHPFIVYHDKLSDSAEALLNSPILFNNILFSDSVKSSTFWFFPILRSWIIYPNTFLFTLSR